MSPLTAPESGHTAHTQASGVMESGTDVTPESPHRAGSPPYERGHLRKKRKTLACYDCRRRKLKCDREYPACGRCVKGGHPETCLYEDTTSDAGDRHDSSFAPNGHDSARAGIVVNGTATGHYPRAGSPGLRTQQQGIGEQISLMVLKQQATIAQLQNELASLKVKVIGLQYQDFNNIKATKPDATATDAFGEVEQDPAQEAYHEVEHFQIRGKGYKTKFYGASDSQMLLLQFTQLQDFIKTSVVTNPRLRDIQNRSRHIRKSVKEGRNKPVYSGTNLAQLVPRREIADMLLNLYMNTLCMIYPFIHKQSFLRLYEQFWQDPTSVSDDYLAKLILAMASVRTCISHPSEHISFLAYKSSLKVQAETWVFEVEAWLEKRSYKHVIRSDFQVKCLLVIAKITSMVKAKRSFTESGTLIRAGMSAGLHRNTAVRSKQLNPFDLELRQRIWAFMKLWDLQSCIERGMPIWAGELGADENPPLNINDDEFGKGSDALPPSRPRDEFTDASFLRISQELFSLRSGITILVNTARSYVDYNEVLAYDAKISEKIHELPKWIDEDTSEEERYRRSLPQYLLECQLRQCQIMLHRPFMRVASTNPRYSYSRNLCLETGAAILEKLNALPVPVRDVAMSLGPDFYRATFSICQSLYISSLVRTDQLFNATRESLSALVMQTICALGEKLLRSGNGVDQHWLLHAAYYFNRTRKTPDRAAEHLQNMIDSVANVHDAVMGAQNFDLGGSVASSVAGSIGLTPQVDQTADNLLFDFFLPAELNNDLFGWEGVDMSNGATPDGIVGT